MKEDYIKRINNVLLFIDQNLDQELNLEYIAKIGNYSPFHFHRIFKAITNETINEYITRKRIEKNSLNTSPQKRNNYFRTFITIRVQQQLLIYQNI